VKERTATNDVMVQLLHSMEKKKCMHWEYPPHHLESNYRLLMMCMHSDLTSVTNLMYQYTVYGIIFIYVTM